VENPLVFMTINFHGEKFYITSPGACLKTIRKKKKVSKQVGKVWKEIDAIKNLKLTWGQYYKTFYGRNS
jgi:hypothetical protein